jgi:hypothetical protein
MVSNGVALLQLAGGVAPPIPEAGNPQRRAVGPGEAGGHSGAGSPFRFKDGIRREDAVLRPVPSVPEGEGFGRRLAARVECGQLAGLVQTVRIRHGADQAPASNNDFPLRYRLVARVMLRQPAHKYCLVARPHIVFANRGRLFTHAELFRSSSASFKVW